MKALSLCICLIVLLCASHAMAEELMVSAAMSLRPAFMEIGALFENQSPGVKVVFNFSSSGKLRGQIEGGAPVDVFASASMIHMDALADKGLIIADTRKDFAGNSIVLAVPSGGKSIDSFSGLAGADVKVISIGNPETSPAGMYAKEVLMHLNLWEVLKPRIVYAETVRQVLDYLTRGEVDAGILYASDIADYESVRVAAAAPEGSHEPIVYPIAVIKGSASPYAQKFIAFVTGENGAAALRASGFGVPYGR